METHPKWSPQNRKRQHAEVELWHDDLPSLPPKRFKSSRKPHSCSKLPPPAFWDNLSKVWLTRRALEELDRRNAQSAFNQSPVQPKGKKPRTRSAVRELKHRAQPALPNPANRYLDRGNLQRFARHGGPDLSDLKGYPAPIDPLRHKMSEASSRSRKRSATSTSKTTPSSKTTTSSRKSRPYDRDFEQKLVDGRVYLDEYEYPDGRVPPPPDNWQGVDQILMQPRPSLSPSQFSDEAFRKFKRANAHAFKEKQITTSVIPIIEGEIRDAKCVAGDIPFTNLDDLTDGTFAPGNPDLFYGARPEQLDRRIRDTLSGRIIPSTQKDLPMAPNFFLAAKGPDGSVAVAKRQACYDGALGARGIQSLQSYGQDEPVYDNNAYTFTSIYHNGQLQMHTTHITPPAGPGQPPEYHMNQINSWSLIGNADTFRQGAAAFRNGRDWAKEKRDQFILAANERARSMNADQSTLESSNYKAVSDTTDAFPVEWSQTSADEFAATSFSNRVEEPEPSEDELGATSFSHPGATSFSYPTKKSEYNDLVDITEESETSADEVDLPTYTKHTPSEKRPSKGSKKIVTKAPRYTTSTSHNKHRSKK